MEPVGRTPIACAGCGTTTAPPPPLTWMMDTDRRTGARWFCPVCARSNLRAVEAKLDRQWW